MMSKEILHIGTCDKFLPPFIKLIAENFEFSKHQFLLRSGMSDKDLLKTQNVFLAKKTKLSLFIFYIKTVVGMHRSDKIILHGLFDPYFIVVLFFMPWLLKKCYWVIWGGDLYSYQFDERNYKWKIREFFRRYVIKNMGNLVTYIDGDADLAREWYGSKGKYIECFMYTSNLYKEYDISEKKHTGINVLVGNSADPSNNHLDIFEKLEAYKEHDITIYTPLSYGNKDYAKLVVTEGKKRFGERFKPLTKLIPFPDYLKLLGCIDVAIFNHKRQQAMGNTITLLGLGKKVYMRSDVTQWLFFKQHEIKVFDVDKIELNLNQDRFFDSNQVYIKNYFSTENYLKQLRRLFF